MVPWRHATKLTAAVIAFLALAASAAGAQEATPAPDVLTAGGGILAQVDSQVAAVVPYAGGTSLPVKVGISGARLDDGVATASSGAVDFGLLGALGTLAIVNSPTLQRLGVPTQSLSSFHLPGSVTADSRTDTEAEATPVFPKVATGPLQVRGGYERATAAKNGPAVGRTEMGAVSVDLGIVKITAGGGVSETTASSDEIRASTSVGELRFDASGASPVMRGLEWRLVQRIDQPPLSTFSFGSAEIGRTRYTGDSPAQAAAGFAAFNKALGRSGLSLLWPVATPTGLSPLTVKLKDSKAAATVVGPLYSRVLSEAINQVESTLVASLPESGLAITVANVGLAALTGRGGAALEVGGVGGTIGRRPVEEFRYANFDQPRDSVDPSVLDSSTDADFGLPGLAGDESPDLERSGPTGRTDDSPLPSTPALAIANEKVPAAMLILGGLLALATVAALDRRRLAVYLATKGQA
jgi:hypothetical protein